MLPVPAAAKWLGGLGALPFVFLAVASIALDGPRQDQVTFALAAYGAVILSFLGGIHWGLSIGGFGPAPSDAASYRRLTISVVPSLVAWPALLFSGSATLLILAAGFLVTLAYDFNATREAEAPSWFPSLRWPLTLTAVASLVLGTVA